MKIMCAKSDSKKTAIGFCVTSKAVCKQKAPPIAAAPALVICRSSMCGGYRFAAGEGDFGAVYHWQEKARPDLCDADGDGTIPAFVEIEPGWFRHQTPRRFACEREADLLDKILSFAALLSRI